MPNQYATFPKKEQDPQEAAQFLYQELEIFLAPLLQTLNRLLDKRLVDTFLLLLVAIMRFRNGKQGLTLSELGSYIRGYHKKDITAPAGTKRIANLIHSLKWTSFLIDEYLLRKADRTVREMNKQGERVLCIHDSSVIEKPESNTTEGLCPVISSKSKRLTRSKRGQVFNEPRSKPVMVTGMHWKAALIVGMQGLPQVALMKWSTTKGDYAENQREEERRIFRKLAYKWNTQVTHVFDRGFASGPWLALTEELHAKVVIRWIKSHIFTDSKGNEKKLWQIGHGKKYLSHKMVKDLQTGEKMPCDIWWGSVYHNSYRGQLTLVKVRAKTHIMRLITNEPVTTEEQAWEIFFTYTRRWLIETSFRYGKSELAMESPRLKDWENTLKLLGLVTLLYSFILHLLGDAYEEIKTYVLRLKCHRTGKRCKNTQAPLYRLRWALSRLWEEHRPVLSSSPPFLEDFRLLTALKGGSW